MDKTIRRHETCIIGLPRCDYVFSSTRSCFIAYGFEESPLEVAILKRLLQARGIEPIEAGGALAPGQNAFCTKICSKVITSQFCVVLLNNDESGGPEVPNANVNMEYGLMMGFNKFVIPFQRAHQTLPFNVAGLDTIKYTNSDFERKASEAVDHAITATEQVAPEPLAIDQSIEAFLLLNNTLVVACDNDADRNIFRLGAPLGFNLIADFGGFDYKFFGNYSHLRPEAVIWRVMKLCEIITQRMATLGVRIQTGMIDAAKVPVLTAFVQRVEIWVVANSGDDKNAVAAAVAGVGRKVRVFSVAEVTGALQQLAAKH